MKTKVAIIGANGQLGSDITKIYQEDIKFEIFPLGHEEIEIGNIQNFTEVLKKISPDFVINTAAYHKVDEVEDNPQKAFLVNSVANLNLAKYCEENNCVFVFISTDYVFGQDKTRSKPYSETDSPGPINVYGVSKLAGEYFVENSCSKYFIIRTSGLFGAAGSSGKGGNFVELMLKLAKERKEIKVVNDQVLSPTYTKNLAQVLKKLLKTKNFGLFHAVSERSCSWYEFAKKIFELTNIKAKLEPTTSKLMKTRAKRPTYSVLESINLNRINLNLNDWEKNLRLYLKEKGYF